MNKIHCPVFDSEAAQTRGEPVEGLSLDSTPPFDHSTRLMVALKILKGDTLRVTRSRSMLRFKCGHFEENESKHSEDHCLDKANKNFEKEKWEW